MAHPIGHRASLPSAIKACPRIPKRGGLNIVPPIAETGVNIIIPATGGEHLFARVILAARVRRKMSSPPRGIAHDDLFVSRANCSVRKQE